MDLFEGLEKFGLKKLNTKSIFSDEENNRKRAYDIPVRGEFDTLTLVPHDAGGTRVISFDFT